MTVTITGTAALTNTQFRVDVASDQAGNDAEIRRALWEGFKQLVAYTDEAPKDFNIEWTRA